MFNDILDSLTVPELKARLKLIPPAGKRPTCKADIIADLRRYLLSAHCREVWQQLDPDEQTAIAETVHNWSGKFDGSRFKAKHGALPDALKPRRYGYQRDRPAPKKDYLSLFMYNGTIPPELCTLLTEFVPVPSGDTMKTVAEASIPEQVSGEAPYGREGKDESPIRRLSTETMARQDLAGLLRLVESGQLSVSEKTGMAGAAAMRKIDALLAGGDYYPPEDDWQMRKWEGSPIRPMRPFAWPLLLQTAGLAKAKGKTLELTRKGKAALHAPFEQTIREIYTRWRDKGTWDEFRRIDQVKGQTSKSRPMASVIERRQDIEPTLCECPPGEWVEVQEFYRYAKACGHYFQVARNAWKLYIGDANYGSMGYAADSLLDTRYLKVYFMEYLATLGLLDIGYSHPYFGPSDYSDLWGIDELLYFSRYDGLLYIRLNALGAYCLGLTEDYTPPLPEASALLEVDETLGIHLLHPPEAAQGLLLEQFAQPVGTDQWRFSLDTLLGAVENGLEPGEFHQFLQRNAAVDLPAEVADLFESIAARRSALTDAGPAQILRCATAALAKALANDPATADSCLYAGGRTLVIPVKSMKRFREGLRKIGYVIPAMEQR